MLAHIGVGYLPLFSPICYTRPSEPPGGIMDIDLPTFWTELFKGSIGWVVGVLTGLAIAHFRRRRVKRREDVLLGLAILRSVGVTLRNVVAMEEKTEEGLVTLTTMAKEWKQNVIEIAKMLSVVEGELLETLDRVKPRDYPNIRNPEQVRVLQYLDGILERVEQLLEKYRLVDV